MNICIDQGNTSTKVGGFENNELVFTQSFSNLTNDDLIVISKDYKPESIIVSSVVDDSIVLWEAFKQFKYSIFLNHTTAIPINNYYKTPKLLGNDRIAAMVGAFYLKPKSNALVIDIGTAITFDYLDSNGNYHGGNIAPGIELRFRSLFENTKKLPYIKANFQKNIPFMGNDTYSAIECGVINGVGLEIDGYIEQLKLKYSELSTFLTGGNAYYFDGKLKNPIFVDQYLVLKGLNRILEYNVQK
jgi:type III pantothenate kinase